MVEFLQIQIPTDRTSGTRSCAAQMLTNTIFEICFSYEDPYQPKELPAESLSGIEKLTCRMFNNDSPFYSALFSDQDQGEVAEVNEEISYVEDEENTIDLKPTVDLS